MKFKVGDKVKIAKLERPGAKSTSVEEFKSLLGKTDRVSQAAQQGSETIYKLKECGFWFYGWMLEPIEKGIHIKAEKVWSITGRAAYRILNMQALGKDTLPEKYLQLKDSIYYLHGRLLMNDYPRLAVLLQTGDCYTKEDFEDALEKIKAAGNMLAEINKKLKWSGVEEFTI